VQRVDDLTTPAKAAPAGADLNEMPTPAAVMIISLLPLPAACLLEQEGEPVHIFPKRARRRRWPS